MTETRGADPRAAPTPDDYAGAARWRILALLSAATSLSLSAGMTATACSAMVDAVGWRWAFALLALGPAVGIGSIRRLAAVQGQYE